MGKTLGPGTTALTAEGSHSVEGETDRQRHTDPYITIVRSKPCPEPQKQNREGNNFLSRWRMGERGRSGKAAQQKWRVDSSGRSRRLPVNSVGERIPSREKTAWKEVSHEDGMV